MPSHFIKTTLPYTQKQLYDLVADIESYPKFIPWCEAARILRNEGDVVFADLVIRFKGVGGKYTSKVFLDEKQHEISVELADGPFKHLNQRWKFSEDSSGATIEFDIDFALRSKFLEKMVELMFHDACEKMITAFIGRAKELYS